MSRREASGSAARLAVKLLRREIVAPSAANPNPKTTTTMSNELFTPQNPSSALTVIESSRAIQEVQAALIIAKRFPRDEKAAVDRILNSCSRKTLAESALYTYARGGSDITGPSIRLAEALAQNWGNLQFGIRELDQANGESTVEAFAWDVETNTRQTKVFQVRHERHTRTGVKVLTDPRDVYELVANQGARRLRACILGIIPGDVVEMAVEQCETTLNADADTSPEGQKKMVGAFAAFGVTKEQIEAFIQRRIDAITSGQVVRLKKIYQSLKDGVGKPGDWFKDEVEKASVPADTAPAKRQRAATKYDEAKEEPKPTSANQTPWEKLKEAMESNGLNWGQVAQVATQGGIVIDDDAQLIDQPEDVVLEIMSAWPQFVQVLKGGAQ